MTSTGTIGLRRVVIAWIAAYLVALHAIVAAFGAAHMFAARAEAGDALSVICHGDPSQTPVPAGDRGSNGAIGFACGLCGLANVGSLLAPEVPSLSVSIASTSLVHAVAAESGAAVHAARAGLARAPPFLA